MDAELKMILALFLLFSILQIEPLNSTIRQIQQCGVQCSEGLHCKSRPHLSLTDCKKHHEQDNVTNIHNATLSTVIRCEENKCLLNLNIVTVLTLHDDVRSVHMCVHSAGMLGRCQIVTFPHRAREHITATKVEVQYDCFVVWPGQDVFVTLKTAPNVCSNTWMQKYTVPECSHEDFRRKVTECITGELSYTVDTGRREITVTVLEAPEDTDYNLRLCLKGKACIGTGPHRLIKKQDLHRNQSFLYTKALPCLCIEGWPARTNARRIQVCPFKNNMKDLWSGVTYDHYTQALSWKPMCPVKAVVSLCHSVGQNICLDIGNVSLATERQNVIFSTVDPHPQLCMKFTTEVEFWIECPFSTGHFPVWNLKVTSKAGQHQVELMSWFSARFSVGLCKMTSPVTCEPANEIPFLITTLDKMKPVAVNLSASMCNTSFCVQVKRIDVQFSIQEHHCTQHCFQQEEFDQWSFSEALKKYALPLTVCVIAFVMVGLVGNVALKVCVWGKREQKLDQSPAGSAATETETLIHTVSEDMDTGPRLA